jgi:hypothetical protein
MLYDLLGAVGHKCLRRAARSEILCNEELLHVPQTFTTDTTPPARCMSPLADSSPRTNGI